MSDPKYQYQIQLRKAKLERMRKEREVVRMEKERRGMVRQQEMEKLSNARQTKEQATKINDSDIVEILLSINTRSKENNKIAEPSNAAGSHSINKDQSTSNKLLNLSICNLQITEIPPKETLTYSKHTQTNISGGRECEVFKNDDDDDENEEVADKVGDLKIFCNFSSILPPGISSPGLPNVKYVAPALTPLDDWNPWLDYEEKKKTNLPELKTQEFILTENFQKSLIRAGRIMEKAIAENKNIFVDYTGAGDTDIVDSKALLSLNRCFCDDHYSKNRCITCMDWSRQFPELLLASYYKNEDSLLQPDGIVMVWNTMFNKETPEFIFNCHSAVMSSCFTIFNPYLILGGTYSGQVVLWDNRVRKPMLPIQYTKLNSKAHTQPIHCLQMVGSESSHNIISISSDGKLCSWSLEMLSQPLDVLQLQLDVSEKQKKAIAITCMDFPENGANSLVLGGEDGCVYSAFRYGYKSGVNDQFEKHDGPVTGISSHYNQSTPDFGRLFLTSSLDCTIKLWSLQDCKPLYTFKDNSDYIMDVAWSPIHPAVFAAVDSSGRLNLWNLNEDTEEPVISVMVKGKIALNRVAWKPNGKHITVGDDDGKLYVYNVAEHLAYPSTDEWLRFNETLNRIKVNYDMEYFE